MINVITTRCPAAKWPSLHHPSNEFIPHIKNSSKSRTFRHEAMEAEIDLSTIYSEKMLCLIYPNVY